MNCRQCGAPIPNSYLSRDSFNCPECGKLYRRSKAPSNTQARSAQTRSTRPANRGGGREPAWKALLKKRIWKVPVWACIAVLLLVIIIASAGGGTDQPSSGPVAPVQTIAAVATPEVTVQASQTVEPAPTQAVTQAPVAASAYPMQIYSNYGITITVEGFDDYRPYGITLGMGIDIIVENANDTAITFDCGDVCCGEWQVTNITPYMQISARSKTRETIILYDDDLKKAGLNTIDYTFTSTRKPLEIKLAGCDITRNDTYDRLGSFDLTFTLR